MRISLRADRRLASVPPIARAVRRLCQRALGEMAATRRAELALVEACTNAVVHAPEGTALKLLVDLVAREGRIEIVVTDDGPPFDLAGARMPELDGADPAALPTGGFGLPLIKACADVAEYRRENDRNVLRVVVRRRGA